MKHIASPSFWNVYNKLPEHIQQSARKHFELLKHNPSHPSLHLKKVGKYWSVRIGRSYRALAVETQEEWVWFWIGTHAEYDHLLS